jgi:hypothetical protein
LEPQQLPPRHTPLEHELLEEHVPPSDFFALQQVPRSTPLASHDAPAHVAALFVES